MIICVIVTFVRTERICSVLTLEWRQNVGHEGPHVRFISDSRVHTLYDQHGVKTELPSEKNGSFSLIL